MKYVVRDGDTDLSVEVHRHGAGYRVRIDERWLDVDLVDAGGFVRSLRLEDGSQFSIVHHQEGNRHEISFPESTVVLEVIDPLAAKRRGRDDEIGATGAIKALMPGRVVRVLVAEGEVVRKGTGLLILEAMKMENEILALADGTVQRIFVTAGQTVELGVELMFLE
ncbi:MAG: acetyl-CoA carboxylase biotin carboxyl carrier protein subunit [Acidobacteriota bacterium]